MEITRKNGIKALETVLNNANNIKIFERNVHNYSINSDEEYEEIYNRIIYQIIGDVLKRQSLKTMLVQIKDGNVAWNHKKFNNIRRALEEHDEFNKNPFEVVEGVSKCPIDKCGNERVFTYTKQCRGADESTTVFYQCMECNYKWVGN